MPRPVPETKEQGYDATDGSSTTEPRISQNPGRSYAQALELARTVDLWSLLLEFLPLPLNPPRKPKHPPNARTNPEREIPRIYGFQLSSSVDDNGKLAEDVQPSSASINNKRTYLLKSAANNVD
jgi:hypothetical protein